MSTGAGRPMDLLSWTLLLALAALWATSFFFTEIALVALDPFTIVLARVGLAALALWPAIWLLRLDVPRDARTWLALAGMGLLNNALPFSLIVWGQTEIMGGEAAILNATTPIFAVVLAHVFTADEKLSAHRLGGVVAGVAGVAVMVGLEGGSVTLGYFGVLGGALSYGVAGVYARRLLSHVDGTVAAAGMLTTATLWILPLALLFGAPLAVSPSWGIWGALVALALPGTALAYVLYFAILARAGATNLLLVTLLIPAGAVALGAAFIGERLGTNAILGMAVIVFSLALIDGRVLRFAGRRTAD